VRGALKTSGKRPGGRLAIIEAGAVLRALADDNRLRILTRLRKGEQCVCTLVDALDCAQPLLSHHLRVLKEAGLVVDRREGRWTYYAINDQTVETIERFLCDLRGPVGPKPVSRPCADA
jgi:ArsR family transcriptional regulator